MANLLWRSEVRLLIPFAANYSQMDLNTLMKTFKINSLLSSASVNACKWIIHYQRSLYLHGLFSWFLCNSRVPLYIHWKKEKKKKKTVMKNTIEGQEDVGESTREKLEKVAKSMHHARSETP